MKPPKTALHVQLDDLLKATHRRLLCRNLLAARAQSHVFPHAGLLHLHPDEGRLHLYEIGPYGAFYTRVDAQGPDLNPMLVDSLTLHRSLEETPTGARLSLHTEKRDGAQRLVFTNDKCKARFSLPCFNSPEPAALPHAEETGSVTAPCHAILQALDHTRFACNPTDSETITGSVLLAPPDNDREQTSTIATDGHRLAWAFSDLPHTGGDGTRLLPRAACDALARLLASQACDASIVFQATADDNHLACRLENDNLILYARLTHVTYPDCASLVPDTDAGYDLEMDRQSLESELRKATLAWQANPQQPSVELVFEPARNRCTVKGGGQRPGPGSLPAGMTYEGVLDTTYHQAPVQLERIHLNARYLLEGCRQSTPGERVRMNGEDAPGKAILMTDPDNPGTGGYLLMPLAA